MCFDVPNVSGFLAWSLVPGNGCAGTLASEGLRDHCDAAEGAALVLRGVATLRRCDAATPLGSPRVFATSRRCDAATPLGSPRVLASSRLRDAMTLRRCHVAGVSSHLRDAATLRRCHAAGGCSRLRVFAVPWRCDAATPLGVLLASSRCRDAATLRRCDAAGGCSRLRVFASSRLRNEILEPALCAQWKLYHLEQLVEQETRWSIAAMGLIPMPSNLFTTLSRALPHVCSYSRNTCGMALCLLVPQHNEDCPWIFFRSLSVSTQGSFYTKNLDTELLHWGTFAQNSFYRQRLLHTEAFTQRSLYTEELLHIDIEAFAQRSLDTGAFTHRNC